MSTKKGKFDFLTEERQQRADEDTPQPETIESAQAIESTDAQSSKRTSASARKSTNAQSIKRTSAQTSTERKPSGQRIRADLLRAFKIMAAETGKPQYLLMEEALEQYLAKKRTK